jgi:flagellar M-ring protein FliF
VRDLNIKLDMDMSKKSVSTEEHFPFTLKPDNPITPYDDSDIRPSVTLSTEKTTYEYQGTGFNPEGPQASKGRPPRRTRISRTWSGRPTRPTR